MTGTTSLFFIMRVTCYMVHHPTFPNESKWKVPIHFLHSQEWSSHPTLPPLVHQHTTDNLAWHFPQWLTKTHKIYSLCFCSGIVFFSFKDGTITLEEFVGGIALCLHGTVKDKCRLLFHVFNLASNYRCWEWYRWIMSSRVINFEFPLQPHQISHIYIT